MRKSSIKNIVSKSRLIRSFIAITLVSSMILTCLTSIGAEISLHESIFSSRQQMNEKTRTAPPNTVRVSITSDSEQLVYNDPGPYSKGAQEATVTPDGRFVVFTSYANNLPGYNGYRQVYVHDRDLDDNGVYDEVGSGKIATVLISKSTQTQNFGDAGNDVSGGFIPGARVGLCVGPMKMVISSNGRFVCFVSISTNFYGNGSMSIHVAHVYLHDRDADGDGTFDEASLGEISTELIDKKTNGGWFYDAGWPVISDDSVCTYVAFCGQYESHTDPVNLYILNRTDGSFTQAELPSGYTAPDYLSLTPDANFIAFTSSNCQYDKICRYDRISNKTTVVVSAAETWHSCFWPSISADGKVIAFTTSARLVPSDEYDLWDVYVWDNRSGAPNITRVSVSTNGEQGDRDSGYLPDGYSTYDIGVSLSPDGNYVAFQSNARHLIDGQTKSFTGIYLRNRLAGTTELVSVNSAGQDPGSGSFTRCVWPSVSFDGRYIAFDSNSPILAPEGDTNQVIDVFVRNHYPAAPETPVDITPWHNNPDPFIFNSNDLNKGIGGQSTLDYTYSTSSTAGDNLFYTFSWGDGTYTEVGPLSSGVLANASHHWSAVGSFAVKVKVKIGLCGCDSDWSAPLMVRMYGQGDINGDGIYGEGSFGDINPFVLQLSGWKNTYYAAFPNGYWFTGDINFDKSVDFRDINPFVYYITNGHYP